MAPEPEVVAPVVETLSPREVMPTSLVARGALTVLGDPPAAARGVCIGLSPEPTFGAPSVDCEQAAGPVAIGSFEGSLSGLARRTTYHLRAYALHESGTVYGANVEVTTASTAEETVVASQGTSPLYVEVGWPAYPGAVNYRVYRDGELLTETTDTFYEDVDARLEKPHAPVELTATEGDHVDRVVLEWSAPPPSHGVAHDYTVVAVDASGRAEPLGEARGFIAGRPVMHYRIFKDGDFFTETTVRRFDDTAAPAADAPTAPSSLTASKGTNPDGVALSWASAHPTNGPSVIYTVTAVNSAGEGAASAPGSGFRGGYEVAGYRVYRGGNFLAETIETTFDDSTAPAAGAPTAPSSLAASAGTDPNGVALSWASAHPTNGPSVIYTVTAVNSAGEGAPSAATSGFRGGFEVTGYRVYRDGDFLAEATARTFNDTTAPAAGAPTAPYSLTASQGTDPNGVALSWASATPTNGPSSIYTVTAVNSAGEGAPSAPRSGFRGGFEVTGYRVYRDGDFLSEATATTFDDTTAPAAGAPAAPSSLTASAGTDPDGVHLSWPSVGITNAPSVVYTVTALNSAGEGPASTPATGRRGGHPVTLYEVSIDDGVTFRSVNLERSYFDAEAPIGPFSMGAPTASKGTESYVEASCQVVATPGKARSYAVRAVNAAGAGAVASASGHRAAPIVQIHWQRSAGDGDEQYSDLAGARTSVLHDYAAPRDGSARFYRCVGTAGGSTQTSSADRGFQRPSPRVETWIPNGPVNAITLHENTVYLGGAFTRLTQRTGSMAAVDAVTGERRSFPLVDHGEVLAVAPDGKGGFYLGGTFRTAGGHLRTRVARIRSDGEVDPDFAATISGTVRAIAVGSGSVFVGGSFSTVDDVARPRLAALHPTTGRLMPWLPPGTNTITEVRALAVDGDVLYVGGDFTHVGGVAINRLAALDATTAAVTSWRPAAPNQAVHALAVVDDAVYLGGEFTSLGGQSRSRLAAVTRSDGSLLLWSPGASGTVRALAVANGVVYAGGEFLTLGGATRQRLGAVDAATGALRAFVANASGTVSALAVRDGQLFVGGAFTSLGGQPRSGLASVDAVSGAVAAFAPDPDGNVSAIAVEAGTALAGGSFAGFGGVERTGVAALSAATGQPTDWNAGCDGIVNALSVRGESVIVGGQYTSLGGAARANLGIVDRTTGLASAFNPSPNNVVHAVAHDDSAIYAGGAFRTIGQRNCELAGALDPLTGSALWPARGAASGNQFVSTLALGAGVLHVGGSFHIIAAFTSPAHWGLAGLTTATGAPTTWQPASGTSTPTRALVVVDDVVYVGGTFGTIGGQPRRGIAAVDASLGSVLAWNAALTGDVLALSVHGDKVAAGGRFLEAGGQPRQRVAILDATTAGLDPWDPGTVSGEVRAVAFDGTTVYIGGDFTTSGGEQRPYFAAFSY